MRKDAPFRDLSPNEIKKHVKKNPPSRIKPWPFENGGHQQKASKKLTKKNIYIYIYLYSIHIYIYVCVCVSKIPGHSPLEEPGFHHLPESSSCFLCLKRILDAHRKLHSPGSGRHEGKVDSPVATRVKSWKISRFSSGFPGEAYPMGPSVKNFRGEAAGCLARAIVEDTCTKVWASRMSPKNCRKSIASGTHGSLRTGDDRCLIL